MDIMKNGVSILTYAKGYIEENGDINVTLLMESSYREAHEYGAMLFTHMRDVDRMRSVVAHLSGLYKKREFKRLKSTIEEMFNLFPRVIDIPDYILVRGEKKLFDVYMNGFISSLNLQMERIDMFADAGIDMDDIPENMNYAY